MSSKVVLIATLIAFTFAASEGVSMKAMEHLLVRSENARQKSMDDIMKGMTSEKAWSVLEKSNLTSHPALIQAASFFHAKRSQLRRAASSSTGLDAARKLLNDMIYESMKKYDSEVADCTYMYSKQCAETESLRSQISASNYLTAESKALVLDSEATIERCQADIGTMKKRLNQHVLMCKHEIHKAQASVKALEGDINVLEGILNMTECGKSALAQTDHIELLQCHDPCTLTSFVAFNHQTLQKKLDQLQSSASHGLVQDSLQALLPPPVSKHADSLLQINSQPQPQIHDATNPCDGSGGKVTQAHKDAAKCTIASSPHCPKIQEKFGAIQGGLIDEKNSLLKHIARWEKYRDATTGIMEKKIENDKTMLSQAQTKLAEATAKQAQSEEEARETDQEHKKLEEEIKEKTASCSSNYIAFETELCALKKIRGELYKMKDQKPVIQDCTVGEWDEGACSAECAGGVQNLKRDVEINVNGGAKCLPLTEVRKCNEKPCPIDCQLHAWGGWSKCSAECGGGVKQKLREVRVAPKHDGKPCGPTSETTECNSQACEKDCGLSRWTQWSGCSKKCDGGTQKRQRWVTSKPEGQGRCPGYWSPKRLQYKECNKISCLDPESGQCSTWKIDDARYTCATVPTCCKGFRGMGDSANTVQCLPEESASDERYTTKCSAKPVTCKKSVDVVLLLDGSGSLGSKGWAAEKKAAERFVDAFSLPDSSARMSVILYSGPSKWSGVRKCFRSSNQKRDCKINTVVSMSNDMAAVKKSISGLQHPGGSTLTSLALMSAQTELGFSRAGVPSVVVVFTDGKPTFWWRTFRASKVVRKQARVLWVPVGRFVPLRFIKPLATRLWKENIVTAKDFNALEDPELVNHVVADICPA